MSTLKTHNLQSPDAGSVNIAMTPNAGMIVAGLSTYSNQINVGNNIKLGNAGVITATSANITSHLTVSGELRPNGNIYISNTQPKIFLTDTDNNSDYRIENAGGIFNIYDETETCLLYTSPSPRDR